MKIAIDIGHNCTNDIGAVLIGNEDRMVMETGKKLLYKLNTAGFETLVVTPAYADSLLHSLMQRVQKANTWEAELYISLHENAGGGRGSEIWTGSQQGRPAAESIILNLAALGFENRGIKRPGVDGKSLYVLKYTNMPALLVEGCFVDSKDDMELFDAEKMADAICKGIGSIYGTMGLMLQKKLNLLKIRDSEGNTLKEDGIIGEKTKSAVVNFQKIMGIAADGVPGQNTSYALDEILNRPVCKVNSRYPYAVRYIQFRMGITVDGIYGSETFAAVLKFQKNQDIESDGIVGKITWDKILIY